MIKDDNRVYKVTYNIKGILDIKKQIITSLRIELKFLFFYFLENKLNFNMFKFYYFISLYLTYENINNYLSNLLNLFCIGTMQA